MMRKCSVWLFGKLCSPPVSWVVWNPKSNVLLTLMGLKKSSWDTSGFLMVGTSSRIPQNCWLHDGHGQQNKTATAVKRKLKWMITYMCIVDCRSLCTLGRKMKITKKEMYGMLSFTGVPSFSQVAKWSNCAFCKSGNRVIANSHSGTDSSAISYTVWGVSLWRSECIEVCFTWMLGQFF